MEEFDPLNPLEHVILDLTKEQLDQIITWFDENSKPLLVINQDLEPTNIITIEQLENFVGLQKLHRRSFHNPSYAEVMNEVEAIHMETQKMLTKDQFIYVLNKWALKPDMKHELKLAFKVFDIEERAFLEIDQLREFLTTYGDKPFNDEEIVEFLRDANVKGDGNIFYSEFVDRLFTLTPELKELQKEYLYEDPDEDPSVPPWPPEIKAETETEREPKPKSNSKLKR